MGCSSERKLREWLNLIEKKSYPNVLAYVEAFNRGDIDALCALFAPDALFMGYSAGVNSRKINQSGKKLCAASISICRWNP